MYDLLVMFICFALTFLIGYILISRVPSLLHTPLMSMTNAISAITIIAALLIFSVGTDTVDKVLGVMAIIMATFNIIGGFVITHRMLRFFRKKSNDNERGKI